MGKKKLKKPSFVAKPALSGLEIERLDDFRLRLNPKGGMRVPGIVYLSPALAGDLATVNQETMSALTQVVNVAHLPGIVKASLAMPDVHWGYGFPIGGVAAFDLDGGVVSPGGVGYDINCGCRLLCSNLPAHQVRDRLPGLVDRLFARIPTGVGQSGEVRVSNSELKQVLKKGAAWAVGVGLGEAQDLEHIEDGGAIPGADPEALSERAMERGRPQLGTLGSGNHFLEIAVVDEVFDDPAAEVFGLFLGQLVVQIHSGSRGLGYQVCDDNLAELTRFAAREGLILPDRQLVYAPLGSPQAEKYLAGMAAAANYAFTNRQILTHLTRQVFEEYLGLGPRDLGLKLVIDVCHNIAKLETHQVDGRNLRLCVHRKGATRAFAAGRSELPPDYRAIGQPVLIPGDMGRASYVLLGRPKAMEETFGSTCHGAGRVMSRERAKTAARGRRIDDELERIGITVRAAGKGTLSEEMPEAYKDVSQVVEVVHGAGLSTKVARLRPLGVIKG